MRDSKETRVGKPCEICGNVGFTDMLIKCFQCGDTREHIYCMRLPFLAVPEIWLCEECRSIRNVSSKKAVVNVEQIPYVSLTNASEILSDCASRPVASCSVYDDLYESNHFRKETRRERHRLQQGPVEEAIELSTRKQKEERSMPTNVTPRTSQSTSPETTPKRSLAQCTADQIAEAKCNAIPISEVLGNGSTAELGSFSRDHSSSPKPMRLKGEETHFPS